jgi:hypothetical protein
MWIPDNAGWWVRSGVEADLAGGEGALFDGVDLPDGLTVAS